MECCTPSYRGPHKMYILRGAPFGLDVSQIKKCLPPSCRFPPKSFPLKREPTISGDTFGTRARATSLRHLYGAANYATCNAPASRRDGALLAYGTSCPRHSLCAPRLARGAFAPVQVRGPHKKSLNFCGAPLAERRVFRFSNELSSFSNTPRISVCQLRARYLDEEQGRTPRTDARCTFSYISGRAWGSDAVIR